MGIKYDIDLQMNVQDARASIAMLKGEITNLKKLVSKEDLKLGAVDANTAFNNLRKGFDTAFKAIQREAAAASSQIEKNIQIKNLDKIMGQFSAAKSTSIDKYGEYAGERFYQKRIDAAMKLRDALSGAEIAAQKLAAAEAKAAAQSFSKVQDKAAANIMSSNLGYSNYKETRANATQKLYAENLAYDRKLRAERERSSDLVAARIMMADSAEYQRKINNLKSIEKAKLAEIQRIAKAQLAAAKQTEKNASVGSGGVINNFTKRLGIATDFSIAYKALQLLYASFEKVKDVVKEVMHTFDEMSETQAKLAMWATFITKGQMSFAEAFDLSKTNVNAFVLASANAISPITELSVAIDEFAQQGVIFGPEKMADMVKFADFVTMVAQTTGSNSRQMRQEIQAMFSGNIRPENQVLRVLKNTQMLSAQQIKELKKGLADPAVFADILGTIAQKMEPMYEKIFNSSSTKAFTRFYNNTINGFVMLFDQVNQKSGKLNIIADVINKIRTIWQDIHSNATFTAFNEGTIRQSAGAFELVAKALLTVGVAFEGILGVVSRVLNAAMFAVDVITILASKAMKVIAPYIPDEMGRKLFKNAWSYESEGPEIRGKVTPYDAESITQQIAAAARRRFDEGGIVKDKTKGLELANRPNVPEKENKAITSAEKHLRDLVDQIHQLGEVSDAPLDTASRKLTAFWDKLNDTYRETPGLSGKFGQQVIDELDNTAPKVYEALFKSMVEDLDKTVQDGTGITIKQAEKYKDLLSDIEEQTNNLTRKQWRTKEGDRPLLAAETKAAVDAKRIEAATKLSTANATREANAMADLYKYSNPTDYEYVQREKTANEFFDKKKAQVQDEQKIAEILAEQQRVISRMQVNRAGGWGAVVNGAEEGIKEYGAKINNTFQNVKESAARAMQSVEDSIVGAFEKGEFGASQFFAMVQHELIKLAVQKTITGPMSTFLGSVLGAFGVKHGGGDIGTTHGSTRSLNPMVFANAPRFHNGLRSDEFPAILQSGESVTRRGGETPTQTIVIENHTGQQVQKQEKQGSNGARELRFIIGDTIKQVISGGQLDTTFKQTFGLKRVGVA